MTNCLPCCKRALGSQTGPLPRTPDLELSDDDTEETLGVIDPGDEKVVINVGGIRHETVVSSLIQKEGTRLCMLAKKHRNGRKDEYFFDRHPGVFNTVMDYYRSGELHVPLDVCGAVVKRELDFWKIDDKLIEACCWTSYSHYIDNQKTLSEFNKTVVKEDEMFALKNVSGWKKQQMVIWMILDHPRSSKLAMAYAVTSFVFVLASIAGFCVETLPYFYDIKNVTKECGGKLEERKAQESEFFLTVLDYICTAFFTLELLVRVSFAPNKLEFFRSVMNIIDIVALMPLYVQIILDATDEYSCLSTHRAVIETILVLRIIRIFRIFHLVKHYRALTILVHAIRASINELLMLAIFLFIATLVFSTLIFYAEKPPIFDHNSDHTQHPGFSTIPIGFWWSIITMTTVGYGDVAPSSAMGCVIGALCAVCGVLLIALTIPVISNNFALFYLHARTREEITKNKKSRSLKKTRSKLSSDSMDRKRGLDSRALLSNESISTTDESAMVLNARTADSVNVTPLHTHTHNQLSIRVPIADIDETIM